MSWNKNWFCPGYNDIKPHPPPWLRVGPPIHLVCGPAQLSSMRSIYYSYTSEASQSLEKCILARFNRPSFLSPAWQEARVTWYTVQLGQPIICLEVECVLLFTICVYNLVIIAQSYTITTTFSCPLPNEWKFIMMTKMHLEGCRLGRNHQ